MEQSTAKQEPSLLRRDATPDSAAAIPGALLPAARQYELAPPRRDRERILPPGAGGPHAAPYRMLRSQVTTRLDKLDANTLAMLSPLSAAGKTLTAINLAIAIAAERDRTAILVDFDLRNPSVHQRFGFEPKLGVEDCLTSSRPVHEAIVRIAGYERLLLLPARNRVENSSELLAESRTHDLIEELRRLGAKPVLIFDLPPVLQADDALLFSRHVQCGLMVVRENSTRREELTRAIELLHDLPLLGTVLNASREPRTTAY
ncbi:MAG: CpsD/CapB family tyrosine-protein kinase [Nevskia sp.]|nr:CpsD/CapB family tyrosine-protein kinase [Nevskia sp.]